MRIWKGLVEADKFGWLYDSAQKVMVFQISWLKKRECSSISEMKSLISLMMSLVGRESPRLMTPMQMIRSHGSG